MAFLSREDLEKIGFKNLGKNVLISDKASIYRPQNISIGENVRIDDFCIISAGEKGIEIGNHVHIACYVSLIGNELIKINDFVGISSKTSVYSSSDDYSGDYLTGPTIEDEFKNVDNRPVIFESYSIIGSGCVVLPGVTIGEGVAVGAISLVAKNLDSWCIYVGTPIKYIKKRRKNMLQFLPLLK
ncbi:MULTISPECIES: acyltransferase [unclassified Flavobacterium]|uniref:acyltransferase n=1 Tax=unclassified Flavobacterium TaxID=196869 RepID=UPI0010662698|nr:MULTISPECIES: acyltransferase [unclassified Flavobacterium]TDX09296.1 galactoside O-acetyltransferase [Flavobacterium sp. S87F.05.LMB.W.Kidney.N]BDU23559.1 acetyltransferase [Flavobacterium sp. GSB-24]